MASITHTVGGDSNLVSFKSAARVPIESLKVHFSPVQEGEGDPSPENVRPISGWDGVEQFYSGKNIGHIVGYSSSSTSSPSGRRTLIGSYGNTINTTEPEDSLIITQTQWPESSNISSYKNGYFNIIFDNLKFGEYYDFSCKITNITNNPLNISLSQLRAGDPSGGRIVPIVVDNILIFKNLHYQQKSQSLCSDISFYNGGMSFTISDIMITPANTNDGVFEPYPQKRLVNWNQWLKPLTAENWQAYNSNYVDVTFENGIATSTWLTNNSGYQTSVRTKVGILQKSKEIWYVSYMIKTSENNSKWGVEFNGGIQTTPIDNLEANVWGRCADQAIFWRGTRNYVYISNYKNSTGDHIGMTAQVKSPIFINLTQMFGPGNEPTKEEFEEQCALNGIDLTSALSYDEGSVREWKTSGELLKNSITFPILGKNKFNINAPFAEPSNTALTGSRIFQPYTYCLGLTSGNNYLPNKITNFSVSNNTLTFTSDNTSYGVAFSIPLLYGTYRLSYTGENISFRFITYDSSGQIIYDGMTQTNNNIFSIGKNVAITTIIFTSVTADTSTTVSNIQIEEGITATEYEEFNPNHTVYGGYVDFAKGELVSTYLYCRIKDLPGEWNYRASNNRFQITLSNYFANAPSSGGIWTNFAISEIYKTSTSNGYGNKQIATYINKHIYIRDDDFEGNVDTFLNSVGDTYITYELAEPTYYSLTPTQLTTFLNQNNFWSNTNGPTEVSYAIYDSEQIRSARKRILAAAPKIEEASGSIATFNTDISAPLKECKVYFEPKQEGEGDPSPDNIRPITGFENININQYGKNLFDINSMINRPDVTVNGDTFIGSAANIRYYHSGNPEFTNLFIPVGTTLTISCTAYNEANISTEGAGFSIQFVYEDNTEIRPWYTRNYHTSPNYYNGTIIAAKNIIGYYFTCYNNGNNIWHVSNFQIELGSTSTSYKPYQNQTIPITFSSEAGTVYGGYVDLINGKLIQEWIFKTFTWGSIRNHSVNATTGLEGGNIKIFDGLVQDAKNSKTSYGNTTFCNICSNIMFQMADRTPEHYYVYTTPSENRSNAQFSLPSTYPDELEIQLVCKLLTPIEYSLTPETLKTFRNTNNIWSNANGDIQVKYWTH